MSNHIESVRIKGFRSLADVEIGNLAMATVLVGANGSGKFNFVRFFEMTSRMIRFRKLAEYVQQQGGADDQLFGGSKISPRVEAKLTMRTESGRNDYRFTLAYAHRFMFKDEAFRFSSDERSAEASWERLGSGHSEAKIVEAARSAEQFMDKSKTARVVTDILKSCAVYQFHDTSYDIEAQEKLRCRRKRLSSSTRWESGSIPPRARRWTAVQFDLQPYVRCRFSTGSKSRSSMERSCCDGSLA